MSAAALLSQITQLTSEVTALGTPVTRAVKCVLYQKLYRLHMLAQQVAMLQSQAAATLSGADAAKATSLGVTVGIEAKRGAATVQEILNSTNIPAPEIAYIVNNGLVGQVAVNEL
jgi:hypothetical protein